MGLAISPEAAKALSGLQYQTSSQAATRHPMQTARGDVGIYKLYLSKSVKPPIEYRASGEAYGKFYGPDKGSTTHNKNFTVMPLNGLEVTRECAQVFKDNSRHTSLAKDPKTKFDAGPSVTRAAFPDYTGKKLATARGSKATKPLNNININYHATFNGMSNSAATNVDWASPENKSITRSMRAINYDPRDAPSHKMAAQMRQAPIICQTAQQKSYGGPYGQSQGAKKKALDDLIKGMIENLHENDSRSSASRNDLEDMGQLFEQPEVKKKTDNAIDEFDRSS